jgi:anti-sigma-K factor RskA
MSFAVTIEPEGGAPGGKPTGPVILSATVGDPV